MELILVVAIFQAIVSLYLLFAGYKSRRPNLYLYLFIIVLAVHLSLKLAILLLLKDYFVFKNLITGFSYVYALFIYLYTRNYLQLPITNKRFYQAHTLIFSIFALTYVFVAAHSLRYLHSEILEYYRKIVTWVVLVLLIYYSYYSFRYLYSAKASTERKTRELKWIVYLFPASVVLSFSSDFFVHEAPISEYLPRAIFYLGLVVISVLFIQQHYNHPEIEREIRLATEDESDEKQEKYKSVNLKQETLDEYVQKLSGSMEKKKLFLDPELTLENLSEQLNIPKHHISQTLNQVFQKNFYQFVNERRIEEVIRRIQKDPQAQILDIAYSCGFNSKSSFNNYFKKITGETPSEFKKNKL